MQTAGKAPSVRAMENRIADLEAEIERLRAQITAAAAFLDRLAIRLDTVDEDSFAADCRAMAKQLRG